jgi:hypothetical protein
MKTNDRYRNTWLLCLLLTVALWAVSGCQTRSAQEPTSTTSPQPSEVLVEQEQATQEPTSTTSPELSEVTVEQEQAAQEPTSTTLPEPSRVTVEQVQQWMDQGEPLVFLDSRNEAAWSTATTKVPGSLRVPPSDVEPYLSQIPRDRRIIVYCT